MCKWNCRSGCLKMEAVNGLGSSGESWAAAATACWVWHAGVSPGENSEFFLALHKNPSQQGLVFASSAEPGSENMTFKIETWTVLAKQPPESHRTHLFTGTALYSGARRHRFYFTWRKPSCMMGTLTSAGEGRLR